MPDHRPIELNRAVPGGRVEIFAIRDDDYPDGWFYRFQYYHRKPANCSGTTTHTTTIISAGTTDTFGSARTPKSSSTVSRLT